MFFSYFILLIKSDFDHLKLTHLAFALTAQKSESIICEGDTKSILSSLTRAQGEQYHIHNTNQVLL